MRPVKPCIAAVALLPLALARITHANAPAGRYTMPTPGVVYDTKTKLTWQQAVPDSSWFTWGSPTQPGTAQNYCAGLTLGGGGAWRLPTVSELQTLVDYTQTGLLVDGGAAPMIDTTFFPNTQPAVFWSATPFAGAEGFAWGVNFTFGNSNGYNTGPANYVRCVR
jgi:hypothetical protein